MTPFLEYVAADLLAKYGTDLSRTAVVFPNKRASLFLNDYLARLAGKPVWSPAYITISQLFRSHSQLTVADPIKLVCDLHQCFTRCTGTDETLDHFFGWGQLLLADFDDIDKNLAPASRVFANLRDIHELDDTSYLTEEQIEMIRRFFSNFSQGHNSELKSRFLKLWSRIGDIYDRFNRQLAHQGLAYEGALYRQVALSEDISFQYDTYVFVGFNLLSRAEQTLFSRLRRQGKARFYWDFDHYYMHHHDNHLWPGRGSEAGHFIAQYLSDFPNELDSADPRIYDHFSRQKQVTFVSAPTENIQARYVSTWLQQGSRLGDGRRTAIVLADEGLLQTVIHSLPAAVGQVNITTGYPLAQTPVATLVSQLISLQTAGYSPSAGSFRLRHVSAVLRHPYARYVSDKSQALLSELSARHIYHPTPAQLSTDEGLTLLFTPLATFKHGPEAASLLPWLLQLVRRIAISFRQPSPPGSQPPARDPLASESLFRMYTLLNRLNDLIQSGDLLHADTATLQRLVAQLVASTAIPFHGEPAVGTQVMGLLETRNLDFDHVLLLSCNEGNLPRGVSDTSFIPYAIRKAYGLTTADHKVAIYAYHFHRLLQRAGDVTLVYNNSTNGSQTGEMSRFMLQLMAESGHHIQFLTLQAGQRPTLRRPAPVDKTDAVVSLLRSRFAGSLLTPTAINRYMRCPLQFFYRYVSNLAEPDAADEDQIDSRVFGNIFHQAAQNAYAQLMQRGSRITARAVDQLLQSPTAVQRAVDDAFTSQLLPLAPNVQSSVLNVQRSTLNAQRSSGLQLISREVIIRYLRQLLEADRRLAPFTILGLEADVAMPLAVRPAGMPPEAAFTVNIGGRIDRLDLITDAGGGERIRVIDYKTGSGRLRPLPSADAIFATESLKDHSDYYLQTFLYSHIVSATRARGIPVSPALLFVQHAGAPGYDPTLMLGKEPVADIAAVSQPFMSQLSQKLAEIFSPALPFRPAADPRRCATCPYAALCGI